MRFVVTPNFFSHVATILKILLKNRYIKNEETNASFDIKNVLLVNKRYGNTI